MIRKQKASNLTIADWCKENHLGTNAFYYRQRKLRRMAAETSPEFVEIGVPDTASEEADHMPQNLDNSTASIQLGDAEIRLTNSASPELIAAIVKAFHVE